MSHYVIMRSDLSSVLCDGNGWIIFSDFSIADKSAKNYCGIAVPQEVATRIITLQQKVTGYEIMGGWNELCRHSRARQARS